MLNIVLFEDMRNDPKGFMVKLSAQLSLDPTYFEEFDYPVKNKTYAVKHQALHKLKRKLS